MELIFNKEEVEALLLEKAESIGIKANKVVFTAPYEDFKSAKVSFEEKKPAAPIGEMEAWRKAEELL